VEMGPEILEPVTTDKASNNGKTPGQIQGGGKKEWSIPRFRVTGGEGEGGPQIKVGAVQERGIEREKEKIRPKKKSDDTTKNESGEQY